MNSASFSVGRHELDHRRATIPRTTARNSAPDPGYPEGARAEKRSASRKPSVVTSVDRDESRRRLRGLQIARRLLAPPGHDVLADLLAFHEAPHAAALHRADVHEHVLAAVARLDESKAFLGIEELHGTCGHHGLLALHCVLSDHASIAWPVIQFWGSWLGTVKRKRREADRKLVARCYLCDRGRNVNPDAGINPALLHWVIGALVDALNGIAIEGLLSRSLRLGARMQVVDAPDAESDCRDILCTGVAVFRGTSNPQGCQVVCFSSGGASAASRSALRSAAFSSLFLFFLSACACCPLSLRAVSTVIRLECHGLPPCVAG